MQEEQQDPDALIAFLDWLDSCIGVAALCSWESLPEKGCGAILFRRCTDIACEQRYHIVGYGRLATLQDDAEALDAPPGVTELLISLLTAYDPANSLVVVVHDPLAGFFWADILDTKTPVPELAKTTKALLTTTDLNA
jgi:hypothetical protein